VTGFYSSKAWKEISAKVRKHWRATGKPCGYCGLPIERGQRTIVDHIVNRRQAPHLALAPSNLQLVHHACNSKKASFIENNTKKPVGYDGLPDDWR